MIKRGTKSRLFVEHLLSRSTKKICRGTFYVLEKIWFWKIVWIRGGENQDFSSKSCCLTVPENIVEEKYLCFKKNLVWKDFLDKMGWGVSRLCVEFVLLHCTKTYRRGTLLCFRKILVPKNVWDRKAWRLSRFSVHTFFRLILQKSYLGAHSWNSKKLWYRNLTRRKVEGMPIKTFRPNFFVWEYRTLSFRPPSLLQNISGIESIYGREGAG